MSVGRIITQWYELLIRLPATTPVAAVVKTEGLNLLSWGLIKRQLV